MGYPPGTQKYEYIIAQDTALDKERKEGKMYEKKRNFSPFFPLYFFPALSYSINSLLFLGAFFALEKFF
jgi:hypothetical protein